MRDAPELRRAGWAAPWHDLFIQAEWLLAGPAIICFDAKSLLKAFRASLPAVSEAHSSATRSGMSPTYHLLD